jgi:uncharacterized YigZ family protein
MNYPAQLTTIDEFSEYSFKEKGSLFIGQVVYCEAEEKVGEILASVKKKYRDATHHCYAYKLLCGNYKYSDDGEPGGTAGIRIFNAIEHFGIVNIFLVVIRYYGGTKLGAGPLGKAYYKAAFEVLKQSRVVRKTLYDLIIIESDFEQMSNIHRVISNHSALITNTKYSQDVTFECLIKPSDLESISRQLIDISKGTIKISPSKAKHYK